MVNRIVAGVVGKASVLVLSIGLLGCPILDPQRNAELQDISQTWMRMALECTRDEGKGPTVEARKLWHASAAMYEAWAAYDEVASGYFTGKSIKPLAPIGTIDNVAETLSHAVFPILESGFGYLADNPPGSRGLEAYEAMTEFMIDMGYFDANGNPVPSEAQALGAQIADIVLEFCVTDLANEEGGYVDTSAYAPYNPPLEMELPVSVLDINYWQPIDVPGSGIQPFLTPHWCFVTPFALPPYSEGGLRIDPGAPPLFGTDSEAEFIDNFLEVLEYSAALDPFEGLGAEVINISPGARGNNTFPNDDGTGHSVNPYTGAPYADNFAKRGDYFRAQAAFLDGNHFNMPTPWWYEIATDILAGERMVSAQPDNKPTPHNLEYDVKLYFALGGAEHDVGIAVWDIKRHYDWVRPITAIRWLGQEGLLPLTEGVVEVIEEGDPLAGGGGENIGELKVKGWRGPYAGVGWILPEQWIPYQHPSFVTPNFAGYTSGHAAFGAAFKEIMVGLTGNEFIPGGLMEWSVDEMPFDEPVSEAVKLQWATYQDVSDDGGLGRLMCGVHPRIDTINSRIVGKQIGEMALERAQEYFDGTADGIVQ